MGGANGNGEGVAAGLCNKVLGLLDVGVQVVGDAVAVGRLANVAKLASTETPMGWASDTMVLVFWTFSS